MKTSAVCLRWVALVGYAAAIFVLSVRPAPEVPLPRIPHLDKAMHFTAYFLLAALSLRVFWRNPDAPTPLYVLIIAVIFATVFGALNEFRQSFVPYRTFDVWDMTANGLGASVAAVAWEPLRRRYPRLK